MTKPERGISVTTLSVDGSNRLDLFCVDAGAFPPVNWWLPFMSNSSPLRHRPVENKFIALADEWSFTDELWVFIYERCKASGVRWWALTTSEEVDFLAGVFAPGS